MTKDDAIYGVFQGRDDEDEDEPGGRGGLGAGTRSAHGHGLSAMADRCVLTRECVPRAQGRRGATDSKKRWPL